MNRPAFNETLARGVFASIIVIAILAVLGFLRMVVLVLVEQWSINVLMTVATVSGMWLGIFLWLGEEE